MPVQMASPVSTVESQSRPTVRIVIVGAGISGLSAAYRLRELAAETGQRLELTLLESSDRAGGTIGTIRHNGFLIESGPDQFVAAKPGVVSLANRLGVASEILTPRDEYARVLVARGDRLTPLPEGFALLAPARFWPVVRSPLFSWRGKCRMAFEPLVRPRQSDEDESIASFVTRRLGPEVLQRAVQPLVGSVYGGDARHISLAATAPQFAAMERSHGSLARAFRRQRAAQRRDDDRRAGGARYGMFATFKLGMSTLPDALAKSLGGACRFGVRVTAVQRRDRGWSVTQSDGQTIDANGVILAGPAHGAAALVRSTDPHLADDLAAAPYRSTVVVHLAYPREAIGHPLNAFGLVVADDQPGELTAASFCNVKYEGRAPRGRVLLRACLGARRDAQLLEREDSQLVDAAVRDLTPLLRIAGEPRLATVHRHRNAMSQYHVGHLQRVAVIRRRATRQPGLALAGNGYGGAGIADCITTGEQAATELFEQLTASTHI
ncbi:MAG: protoporphyrinogen oxidase [Phycisphaerae bacterium]|jgi:oxygen-dependent protoporphyrinogen oxidase|nr:protoporphyrinogen oxidase [Phycisphaerae bacterium]